MKKTILISFVFAVFSFANFAQAYTQEEVSALMDSVTTNRTYVEKWCEKALKKDKKCSDAYLLQSMIELDKENMYGFIEKIDLAIKYANKKSVMPKWMLYAFKGDCYLSLEEYAQAINCYNNSVKSAKKEPKAYNKRADFYINIEEYAKAEADYRAAMALSNDVKYKVGLSSALMYQEKYDESLALLNQIIKYQPRELLPYHMRSRVNFMVTNFNGAIDDCLRYIDLGGEPDVDYFLFLAKYSTPYAYQQLTEKARKDSENYIWRVLKINLLVQDEKYESALVEIEAYESDYGKMIFTLYKKQICYEGLYQFSKQLETIDSLMLEYDEVPGFLYQIRGDANRNLNKLEKAIADYDKAIALDPNNIFTYSSRAWTYEMLKNYDAALRDYNTSIEAVKNPWTLIQRSKILRMNGDEAAAVADLKLALELDTIGNTHAFALVLLGRVDEGIAFMRNIVKNDLSDVGNLYDLACVLALTGKTQEAASTLKKAVEAGYRNYNHILNDSDLNSIREEADYKEALSYISKQKTQSLFDQLNSVK